MGMIYVYQKNKGFEKESVIDSEVRKGTDKAFQQLEIELKRHYCKQTKESKAESYMSIKKPQFLINYLYEETLRQNQETKNKANTLMGSLPSSVMEDFIYQKTYNKINEVIK